MRIINHHILVKGKGCSALMHVKMNPSSSSWAVDRRFLLSCGDSLCTESGERGGWARKPRFHDASAAIMLYNGKV